MSNGNVNMGLLFDVEDPYIVLNRQKKPNNKAYFNAVLDEISSFILESFDNSGLDAVYSISEIKPILPLLSNYKAKYSRKSMTGIIVANAPTTTSQPQYPCGVRVKYQLPVVLTLFTDVSGLTDQDNIIYDLFAHVVAFLRYFPGERVNVMRVQVLNQQLQEQGMDAEAKNLLYQINLLVHGFIDYQEDMGHFDWNFEFKPGGSAGNSGGGGSIGAGSGGSSGGVSAAGRGAARGGLLVNPQRRAGVKGKGTNTSALVFETDSKTTNKKIYENLIVEKYWDVQVKGKGRDGSDNLISVSLIPVFSNKRQYRELIEKLYISEKKLSNKTIASLIRTTWLVPDTDIGFNYGSLIFITSVAASESLKTVKNLISSTTITSELKRKNSIRSLIYRTYIKMNMHPRKYMSSVDNSLWKKEASGAWTHIVKEIE